MKKNSKISQFVRFTSLALVAWSLGVQAGPDLFEKITITSSQAQCRPGSAGTKDYLFSYQGDVKVVFADQSFITADQLTLDFCTQKADKAHQDQEKKDKEALTSFIKKITFTGHVCMQQTNKKITAERACLDMKSYDCTLEGNVTVKQAKEKAGDIPVDLKSEKAVLNLKTEQCSFLGTSAQPVSTTIELGVRKKEASDTISGKKKKRKRRKIRFL